MTDLDIRLYNNLKRQRKTFKPRARRTIRYLESENKD